jgi:hypothetical protein
MTRHLLVGDPEHEMDSLRATLPLLSGCVCVCVYIHSVALCVCVCACVWTCVYVARDVTVAQWLCVCVCMYIHSVAVCVCVYVCTLSGCVCVC